jgi:hypothetical protein
VRTWLFFLVILAAPAWAQEPATGRIEGVLLEKGTRLPLAGLNVYLLPGNLKAVTGADGRFVLDRVPAEKGSFVVNAAGYERLDVPVDVKAGDTLRPKLFLERVRYEATFETTIVGREEKRDDAERTLTQEQFATVPGAGGDAIKAVANLPGVNRAPGFSANIVIQGSEPQATSYLIDGHEVPLIFHFGGLSTVVFPEAIESVDYLSAGYGPEYGRALGGLVGVRLREPRRDRWRGLAFADVVNAGGLVEGGITEKTGFLLSFRQSYIGEVLRAVVGDDEDFNFTVAPRYTDVTALLTHEISPKNLLRLTRVLSLDAVEFLLENPVNDDPALRGNFENDTRFFRLIPRWSAEFSDSLAAELSMGAGWTRFRVATDENLLQISTWSFTPKGEVKSRLSRAWTGYFGMDHRVFVTGAQVILPNDYAAGGVFNPLASGDEVSIDVSRTDYQLGFYNRNVLKWEGSSWTLQPGFRVDYFDSTEDVFIDPRVAVSYDVSESLRLGARGGLYHQAPEPRETNLEVGNPDLSTPNAWHLAFGGQKDFRGGSTEGWVVEAGGFFRWFDDLTVRSNRLVLRDGELVPEYFNDTGAGTAYGGEAMLRWNRDPWNLMLAYTLLRSRRSELGVPEYPAPFDQTHNVNLIAGVDLPRNWRISTRVRYVTGNPFTPVVDASYDADANVFVPERGAYYSERLDPFFQWDLRVDKKWVFNTWILSAYLDLQNATNRMNTEAVRYAYDFSRQTTVRGLPILPTLGVKGEF